MSTLGFQGDGVAVAIDRLLGDADRCGGLEGHAELDGLSVADPTLDAAGAIARRNGGCAVSRYRAGSGNKRIVVLAAVKFGSCEATADLEPLYRRQREHCAGELGAQLVEDRLAESQRYVANAARDDAAHGIPALPGFVDFFDHFFGGVRVGTANDGCVDLLEAHGCGIHLGLDRLHPIHPGQHLDACHLGEDLARDGSRGHAADGFASARATAALPVANAVLGLVGEVGVGGPVQVLHVLVGRRASVRVADQECDRSPERYALENSRQNLDFVRLFAGRCQAALSRFAAVEISLDLGCADLQPRRTSVDHDPYAAAVGFPKGCNLKGFSKLARHPFLRVSEGRVPVIWLPRPTGAGVGGWRSQ